MNNRKSNQPDRLSRRNLLRSSATAAAFAVVPGHVLGGYANAAPSEKINVAVIGTGQQ